MAPDLTALLGRGRVPQQPRWHRLTLHEGRESPERSPRPRGAQASLRLSPSQGGSQPFSPPWIISLMQEQRTKTLRLAVIIACK